jgi:DNA-binding LacI/PurR family transcriptional regulator
MMLELVPNAREPYYEQIRNALRRQIRTGLLKAGDALPDERSLASQLKVSRKTVRRAYVDLTNERLLERICGRGTFVCRSVRPSKGWRKGVIGIATMGDGLEERQLYYYRLMHGLALASNELGLPLSFKFAWDTAPGCFPSLIQDQENLRGVICVWMGEEYSIALKKLRVPIVLLESLQPKSLILLNEASHDPEPGVYAAVKHLLELGHRRIGFLRSAVNSLHLPRLKAYDRALAEYQIRVDRHLIHSGIFTPHEAYLVARRELNKAERAPTAFVCAGDNLVSGIFAASRELHLRIPEDLSVVGFGDEGYYFRPELSTVRVPIEKIAAAAMRLLLALLKEPSSVPQRIVLPTEFILRGTCGRAPR